MYIKRKLFEMILKGLSFFSRIQFINRKKVLSHLQLTKPEDDHFSASSHNIS